MLRKYQNNYASIRPQMYDIKSRQNKALRIVKTLEDYFGKEEIKKLTLLDVGASTGIIDSILAKSFRKVIGTDIDRKAISFATNKFKKSNLKFKVEDAMKLSFKENTFDIVICTHVYEHVPNPKKLFEEIYRVLKPGGVCYLAAQNKLWPLEAHHNLLFLSYLPKNIADIYIRLFRDKKEYYEHPMSYWQLMKTLKKFKIHEYTSQILDNPKKFGYNHRSIGSLSYLLKYFTPTLFWVLEK
jgi:2-polyprenyl-3-methyl-5-hydroxy-6-metoxy-1,4-benzoquinol methylase